AVEDEAQIELARHLQPLLDEHARDDAPVGAGLMGDERHADHVAGDPLGLVRRAGELDAAALAAATRVDLLLDDDNRAAKTAGNLASFGGGEGDFALGNRHAVARKNRFTLIFVDFHRGQKTPDASRQCADASRRAPRRPDHFTRIRASDWCPCASRAVTVCAPGTSGQSIVASAPQLPTRSPSTRHSIGPPAAAEARSGSGWKACLSVGSMR